MNSKVKKVLIFSLFIVSLNNIAVSKQIKKSINKSKDIKISTINWKKLQTKSYKNRKVIWEKYQGKDIKIIDKKYSTKKKINPLPVVINSLNRSVVFNNYKVGPDISWLVPPGLSWNNKYLFDGSLRGHNRRDIGESFLGWNGGDAVGQFYYHFFKKGKYGLGLNLGMRSIYQGNMPGGTTPIGEGLSTGFRFDYELSNSAGIALGAEQLVHFDGLTDTGRDLYITASKGFWKNGKEGEFPLDIFTAGFGTGKMAEGNIKGLCSDLFGGSGTEVAHQRSLCWAPVFNVSRVYNENISTFFEYNSKWFLLGTSYAPFEKIPARATFAIQLSDHIDNYKINNFQELKYVFRLSLGF
tara:strand:- start:826 stop:1887 length:1062 start_codon:yes stop_codon:yes gene_type:complete